VYRFGVTPVRRAGQPAAETPAPVPSEGPSLPPEELAYGPVQVQGINPSPGETAAHPEKKDSSIKWSWQSSQSNLSFSAGSPLQSGVGTRPIATARPTGALSQENGEKMIQWTAPGLEQQATPGLSQWTAPGLSQQPAELSFRQQGPAAPAPAPGLSDRELRQAADRVYQIIEDRLRQERRRLDL